MKEAIERLKALDERAKKYYWKDESEVVVKLSDVRLLIDFYESHKKESEATPNFPGIPPEWDKIPDRFKWVAIDGDGEEIAHQYEPHSNFSGFWMQKKPFSYGDEYKTGRFFDMKNIDWTKTLSNGP